MNNATMTGGEAKRTRRLLLLGILLLGAAVAITAGRLISSRMRQARLTQDRPADLQWGTSIYSPATAATAQGKRDKYLAKANLLRDHWRVWAVKHQDLLRQLRNAPPNDTATLMRVYSALPSAHALAGDSAGVTLADLHIDDDDFIAGRGTPFTWQPGALNIRISDVLLRSDPQAQAKSDQSDKAFLKALRRDFAAYHGIMLSESMAAGSSRITLWADGRITEMVRQDQHIVGKPTYMNGPEKQLAPAYDFLR